MSRGQIGELVLRMQESFVVKPDMTLSLQEAERRFGYDEATCEAILTALVDAGVLIRVRSDSFARLFPRLAAGQAPPVVVPPVAA